MFAFSFFSSRFCVDAIWFFLSPLFRSVLRRVKERMERRSYRFQRAFKIQYRLWYTVERYRWKSSFFSRWMRCFFFNRRFLECNIQESRSNFMKITIILKKIKPRMNELHHSHFLFGCRNQKISSSIVQPTQEKDDSMLFFFCFFRKQSTEATGIEAQPMTRGLMCVYSLLVLIFFGFFCGDRKLRRRPPWPEGNRRPQCVWWKRTRRRRTELGRHFRGAARRKLDAGVDTFHPRDTTHEFTRPNKKTKKKTKKTARTFIRLPRNAAVFFSIKLFHS